MRWKLLPPAIRVWLSYGDRYRARRPQPKRTAVRQNKPTQPTNLQTTWTPNYHAFIHLKIVAKYILEEMLDPTDLYNLYYNAFSFQCKWSCTLLKRPILIPPKKKQLQRRNPCNQKRIQKTILNPLKRSDILSPPNKKTPKPDATKSETPTALRRSASGNLEGLNIGRRSRRKRPPVAHPRHRRKTDVDEFVAPKSTHRLP